MTGKFLPNTNISPVSDHVSGTAVPEGVGVETRCLYPARSGSSKENLVDSMSSQRVPPMIEEKLGFSLSGGKSLPTTGTEVFTQ